IDRVELLLAFERSCGRTIDEWELAACLTVGELKAAVERALSSEQSAYASFHNAGFPKWNRNWFWRLIRRAIVSVSILPLTRLLARPVVSGLDNLNGLAPPVIFAANHQSHLDTPLLVLLLPKPWRYRIAPAMYKEYFRPYFSPEKYSKVEAAVSSLEYYLTALLANAFPIPQEESGVRD